MIYDEFATPIGRLRIAADDGGLRFVIFERDKYGPKGVEGWTRDAAGLKAPREQLLAYFAGECSRFDLALNPVGTAFQRMVWQTLAEIPYGRTWSYGELARRIGEPKAVRAVGAANGRNPLPIVLPCHRVIGSDGSLTGFGGGLPIKRFLLDHEGVGQAQLAI